MMTTGRPNIAPKTIAALVTLSTTLLTVPAGAQEKKLVAVLEFRNQAGLSEYEGGAVTDMLRIAAREKLSDKEYLVMTRENMVKLLPPGTDLSRCSDAECEVDVGRKIGADFVVAGEVGRFGSVLQVKMKLYDTRTGDLMGGQIAEAKDVDGLKDSVKSKASVLFARLVSKMPARKEAESEGVIETRVIIPFGSEPEGAKVLVDGKLLCERTPCTKSLSEGPHQVSMQLDNHVARAESIVVKKGLAVHFRLDANLSWLSVTSTPSGIPFKVNGEARGQTPVERLDLKPGSYEVAVASLCHAHEKVKVFLEPGQEKVVALPIRPRTGVIDVVAEDEKGNEIEAQVFVDGKEVGTTPGVFKVPLCSKTLEARHKDAVRVIDLGLKENEVKRVAARFEGPAAKPPEPVPIPSPSLGQTKGLKQPVSATEMSPPSDDDDLTGLNVTGHILFWGGVALAVGGGILQSKGDSSSESDPTASSEAHVFLYIAGGACAISGIAVWGVVSEKTSGKKHGLSVTPLDGSGLGVSYGGMW
ncbi:MAG: PEGA domain-containing protein [Deltaproteobacteria bacterium]|nr:PEGA domain-containing protein [Deltaproteobacteria bacterium]